MWSILKGLVCKPKTETETAWNNMLNYSVVTVPPLQHCAGVHVCLGVDDFPTVPDCHRAILKIQKRASSAASSSSSSSPCSGRLGTVRLTAASRGSKVDTNPLHMFFFSPAAQLTELSAAAAGGEFGLHTGCVVWREKIPQSTWVSVCLVTSRAAYFL